MYSPFIKYRNRHSTACSIITVMLSFVNSIATFSNTVFSDTIPQRHAFAAAQLCQEKKMSEALLEIELAIADQEESTDMYTWYVRGFIYKEQYKLSESSDRHSLSRTLAAESFLKSKAMADNDDEVTLNHNTALKYIASTYYNDAMKAAIEMQVDEKECDDLMNRYYTLMNKVEPGKDFVSEYKEFYTAKAQRYFDLWTAASESIILFNKCSDTYQLVLALQPDDCNAQYNLGVLYYNKVASDCKDAKPKCADNSLVKKSSEYFAMVKQKCATEEMLRSILTAEEFFMSLESGLPSGEKKQ